MVQKCRISTESTVLVQLIVASLLSAIAFRLGNQGVLTGAMLISPIGGIVLKTAMGNRKGAKQLLHLYLPVVIGAIVGFLPNNGITKTLKNSGFDVLRNPSSLADAFVIAVTCGILFPMLKQVPEVGVDIATQILPPLVAVGFCLSLAWKGDAQWGTTVGCLLLFLTYIGGLYVSTRITRGFLCKGHSRDE